MTAQEFWKRTIPQSDGCLFWGGYIEAIGYGAVRTRGTSIRAHRLAWEFTHGAIPTGLLVHHKCRNRPCVNPTHLELTTVQAHEDAGWYSLGKQNRSKTHCSQGHEFTLDNTYQRLDRTGRQCKRCHTIRQGAMIRNRREDARKRRIRES